jgi:hypothetical protein
MCWKSWLAGTVKGELGEQSDLTECFTTQVICC